MRPHGIVLVTGPTGSGKTTTLYAALKRLNSPDVKIITVEDPVEYQLDGINQIQVKPRDRPDFADALRSILRQDPDIIMVGEIRDLETAQIAVQAALTGHLVLSTLHTNDAASAITRLLDMGIEDYLLTSTVNAVLAQRLVRRLCAGCREPYDVSPELAASLRPGRRRRRRTGAAVSARRLPGLQRQRLSRPHDDHRTDGAERRDPLAGAAPGRGRGDPGARRSAAACRRCTCTGCARRSPGSRRSRKSCA